MPQLIVGILVIIAAIYALIYALSILVYALLLGAPAMLFIAALGSFLGPAFVSSAPKSTIYELQNGDSSPSLLRISESGDVGQYAFYAMVIAILLSAIGMYFGAQNMLEGSGSDPAWVRKGGIAGAVALVFCFAVWFHGRLKRTLSGTTSQLLEPLTEPLSNYLSTIQRFNETSKPLGFEVQPEWKEILRAATNTKPEDTIEVMLAVIRSKIENIGSVTSSLSQIVVSAQKVRQLAEVSSERAARIAANSLLRVIDKISEVADPKVVARRFLGGAYSELLTDLRSAEQRLRELTENIQRPKKEETNTQGEPPKESYIRPIRTVSDALIFLGIASDASKSAIDERLIRMSNFYHPDKATAQGLVASEYARYEEIMKQINQAKQILASSGRI